MVSSRSCQTRMLSIVFLLCLVFGLISSCASVVGVPRENKPEVEGFKAKWLDGQNVIGFRFKVRYVKQADTDLCWAACLEQALVLQGVDTDQRRILEKVYPEADTKTDKTINKFWWSQMLSITEERLSNGSKVWARLDLDGGGIWPAHSLPITSIRIFKRKIFRELDHGRIPIVGISTEHGAGHMVTVIGAASLEINQNKQISPDDIVGFVIYDPSKVRAGLVPAEDLFKLHTALVYVTIFDTGVDAATGLYRTTLKKY